jgi:putative N6-adenine-specific DNA methylase
MNYSYFCPCPRGLEAALAEELNELAHYNGGVVTLKVHNQVPGGVHCSGTLEDAYLVNLHSRIASRVLLRMAHGAYKNENDIYDLALEQAWEDWFKVSHTIREVTITQSRIHDTEDQGCDLRPFPRHSQYPPVC